MRQVLGPAAGQCQRRVHHRLQLLALRDMREGHQVREILFLEFHRGTLNSTKDFLHCSVATGRSAFLLVADQGSGDGLDLSQPAINAVDAEWFRAGNTPCFWVPADPSRCDGSNQVREVFFPIATLIQCLFYKVSAGNRRVVTASGAPSLGRPSKVGRPAAGTPTASRTPTGTGIRLLMIKNICRILLIHIVSISNFLPHCLKPGFTNSRCVPNPNPRPLQHDPLPHPEDRLRGVRAVLGQGPRDGQRGAHHRLQHPPLWHLPQGWCATDKCNVVI